MTNNAKVALSRLVGTLLLTDGFLTDAEHDYFLDLMERLALDDDLREEVRGSISLDSDMSADIAFLARAGLGDRVLEEMARAIELDEGSSAAELDFIDRIKVLLKAA